MNSHPEPKRIVLQKRAARQSPHGPGKPIRVSRLAQGSSRLPAFFSKRYKLLESAGKGGTSAVYKARDTVLNMTVAIKFLPERLTRDRAAAERFKHEAGLAMRLSHEHIVKLHNLETERGRIFLVMEFIEGRDFREVLNDTGALPLSSALQVAGSCAFALDYAHERSVLHMDLKPENLMLTSESVLKIIDFGTARRIGKKLPGDDDCIEGSPPYMSPEQIRGHPLDRRTDVYSLGAIVYELLEGRPPFAFSADRRTIAETNPPPLGNVSQAVAGVVTKALAKDREERWGSAGEFYRELLRTAAAEGITPV